MMANLSKPLRGMINIGNKIADRLESVGIITVSDLEKIGVSTAYRMVKAAHPGTTTPVCYYLYSLQGALENKHWNDISEATKKRLLAEIKYVLPFI